MTDADRPDREARRDRGVADHVAIVTLTRPEKHNALDMAMFEGIIAAAARVRSRAGRARGRPARRGTELLLGARRRRRDGQPARVGRADGPAARAGPQLVPARRLRLDRGARTGDRRDPRPLPRRRPPDRARRRHQVRHARRAAVGDGDQVGADPRHGDHAHAAAAGRHRRRQGAHVHRPDRQRRRGPRARAGDPRARRSACRRAGARGRDREPLARCRPRGEAAVRRVLDRLGRRRRSGSRPTSSSG